MRIIIIYRLYLTVLFFLFCSLSIGQKLRLDYAVIPDSLKRDANIIIRDNITEIERFSVGKMTKKEFIAITVLNEKGDRDAFFYLPYDKLVKVVSLSGRIYNSSGVLVTTLKINDFYDASSYEDFLLFSDNRARMLTPKIKEYPYTVEYEYETLINGFVHISSWFPVPGFNVAVEEATLKFTTPLDLKFKPKAENYPFKYEESETLKNSKVYQWSLKNFKPVNSESFLPSIYSFLPNVILSPVSFEYDGYSGDFTSWNSYGKWVHSLLKGRMDLPEETTNKIRAVTESLPSTREKVNAVYKYVQNKTRYIAISEGIGGLQPMLASDVDKYGYGDCKALSNYTRSLLAAIGITSYYTVIGADDDCIRYSEYASKDQTNHVILTVPIDNDTIWLECTNQFSPLGYVGDAIANRKALMITEEGGKIIEMPYFVASDNKLLSKMNIKIMPDGSVSGDLSYTAQGLRFEEIGYHKVASEADLKNYLLKTLPVNNIQIEKIDLNNEGDENAVSTMFLNFNAKMYSDISGDRMFVPLNKIDKFIDASLSKKERVNDIFLAYGKTNEDQFEFVIPSGYEIDFLPKADSIDTPFGYYCYSCEFADGKVLYNRKLVVKSGTFKKDNYPDFYDFYDKVRKFDNAKIVLKKI